MNEQHKNNELQGFIFIYLFLQHFEKIKKVCNRIVDLKKWIYCFENEIYQKYKN